MADTLFYTHQIQGTLAHLSEDEAGHATRTLRLRIGDAIRLTDGCGSFYEGTLAAVSKKGAEVNITRHTPDTQARPALHIAVAPTKMADRWEWFLEKATEIGVTRITPLRCMRSERRELKRERGERILLAAIKQSAQSWLPILDDLTDFKTFIQAHQGGFIAHCSEAHAGEPLFALRPLINLDTPILIGPEGDFHETEIQQALALRYRPVTLGDTRLRTETAALYATVLARL